MKRLTPLIPYLAGLVVLAAWFTLVILGQTEPQPFINALLGVLSGLGVHTVHLAAAASKSGGGNA